MNEFTRARLKLTLFYILISVLMLTVFSFAAIYAERIAFIKIQTVFGDPKTRPFLSMVLSERITNFEGDFIRVLFLFDGILIIFSAVASWFLSGKTLKPIEIMIDEQKNLAADISHELRTPLTTIAMEVEAIKNTNKNLNKDIKDAFVSILEEVFKMRSLVDGLLYSFRPNSTVKEKVNLSQIIKHTLDKMKFALNKKKARVKLSVLNDIFIKGDAIELSRMFSIFIDNALKYSKNNLSINVQVKKNKNKINLIISDNGIGIPESDLKYIYQRFYRGLKHKKYSGSGLGLNIAKKIIEKHRGEISVESKIDKGTIFTLVFPAYS